MRRTSFFLPKAGVISARGVVPFYQVQRATFSFKDVTRACKTPVTLWQQALAGMAISFLACCSYYYSASLATNSNEPQFSQEQVVAAATWWVQFLKLETQYYGDPVALRMNLDEKIKKFIQSLSEKMQLQKLEYNCDTSDPYVQIDACRWGLPKIVRDSLSEAGFNYPFMRHDVKMKLYKDGFVTVNDEYIYENPSTKANPSEIVISGNKFREITIPVSAQQELWERYYAGRSLSRYDPERHQSWLHAHPHENQDPTVYARVYLRHFKGSEADFLKLTNEDWIFIFSKWFLVLWYLKQEAPITYVAEKISPQSIDHIKHLGLVTYQCVSPNNREDYYEETTGPVRILPAPKTGKWCSGGYRSRTVDDIFFQRLHNPEKGAVYYLPTCETAFLAKPLPKVDNPNPVAEGKKDLDAQFAARR